MSSALELRGVSKAFRAIRIATDLDLRVAENEAIGILGPNGAGKTTILGLITGALSLDAGSVHLFGRDVSRLAPEARCRLGVARAYQVPQPFGDMTVFENLMVGAAFGANANLSRAQQRSLQILEDCGLAAQANTPAGRLTLLNRKRLELARALATEPKVLLLDEIAGGLNQHECEDLVAPHQARTCGRRHHRLDRARSPRAAVGGDTGARALSGQVHRRRAAAGRDPRPQGCRNLYGDRGRWLRRRCSASRRWRPSTAISRRFSASTSSLAAAASSR